MSFSKHEQKPQAYLNFHQWNTSLMLQPLSYDDSQKHLRESDDPLNHLFTKCQKPFPLHSVNIT